MYIIRCHTHHTLNKATSAICRGLVDFWIPAKSMTIKLNWINKAVNFI